MTEQVAVPVESTGWDAQESIAPPLASKATLPPSGTGETVAVSVIESPTDGVDGSGAPSVMVVAVGPEGVVGLDVFGVGGATPKPAGSEPTLLWSGKLWS